MKSSHPLSLLTAVTLVSLVCPLAVAALLTLPPGLMQPARADMSNPALQMALGNPDKATSAATNRDHYLIRRPQLALSYNDSLRFPNWVSWHLSQSDIGGVNRGQFQPDPLLPTNFTRVVPSDYSRSGYDRGHNCPSKDRTTTRLDNDAVFYMTNMTPQAHGMNAGPWEGLESYSRDVASAGSELFITAGHSFSQKAFKRIGRAGVAVPDFGWKIVVVVPPGSGDAVRRISAITRVIAVRMPNISTISKKDWREYRTSVADIEQATGLIFFDKLPKATADALKERVDFDRSAPSKRPPVLIPNTGSGTAGPEAGTPGSANTAGMVWVNLKSGVYWRPGTRYYGKTKEGKYLSEADAIKAGYHAAGGQ